MLEDVRPVSGMVQMLIGKHAPIFAILRAAVNTSIRWPGRIAAPRPFDTDLPLVLDPTGWT